MDNVFVEFLKLFDTLIGLTSIQQELYSIALEVGKVRRRVNALEYVTIPNLQETIAYIEEKLEEMERENTTRLRTELHTKKADIVQLEHLLLLILLFAQLSDLPPFSASVFLDF